MKRVLFLHIPKTAGQSVHSELVRLFGAGSIAPVRVNRQFAEHDEASLAGYRVFSGHLDWRRLDFVPEPRVTFTVLRDPVDRIASYYLYLKKEGLKLSEEEAVRPVRRALYLARTLSLEDYFFADLPERDFIDAHYDNFYTYFFAGRHYRARRELRARIGRDFASEADIVALAEANLATLDFVCDIGALDRLEAFFLETFRRKAHFVSTRVNVNTGLSRRRRLDDLRDHGLTRRVEDRIMEMARLDGDLVRRTLEERESRHRFAPERLGARLSRVGGEILARITGRPVGER